MECKIGYEVQRNYLGQYTRVAYTIRYYMGVLCHTEATIESRC